MHTDSILKHMYRPPPLLPVIATVIIRSRLIRHRWKRQARLKKKRPVDRSASARAQASKQSTVIQNEIYNLSNGTLRRRGASSGGP